MKTKASSKPKLSLEDHLRAELQKIGPGLLMTTFSIETMRKACRDPSIDYRKMVEAAEKVSGKEFDLTPRRSDDFSSEPYLWVTPRPKPLDPKVKHSAPEMCWMGANANGGGPIHIKEGVLIFSEEGYAYGALVKRGIGDIDTRKIPWKKIVESGSEEAAVLDYAEGNPLIIIPAK